MIKTLYAYWRCYKWQKVEEGKLELRFEATEREREYLVFIGKLEILLPEFKAPIQLEVDIHRSLRAELSRVKEKLAKY